MTTLRVLYLDRNMLTHVGGLEGCGALDTLHVTSNQIQRLDYLPPRCRHRSLPAVAPATIIRVADAASSPGLVWVGTHLARRGI
jgi:hypothetical protein